MGAACHPCQTGWICPLFSPWVFQPGASAVSPSGQQCPRRGGSTHAPRHARRRSKHSRFRGNGFSKLSSSDELPWSHAGLRPWGMGLPCSTPPEPQWDRDAGARRSCCPATAAWVLPGWPLLVSGGLTVFQGVVSSLVPCGTQQRDTLVSDGLRLSRGLPKAAGRARAPSPALPSPSDGMTRHRASLGDLFAM